MKYPEFRGYPVLDDIIAKCKRQYPVYLTFEEREALRIYSGASMGMVGAYVQSPSDTYFGGGSAYLPSVVRERLWQCAYKIAGDAVAAKLTDA